jgi:hypothetical protein
MKITIFRNDGGKFTLTGTETGLDSTSGWWSSMECTDIDNDGDTDIIGGNIGLNSMIKASTARPATLYLNDFDNSGSLDPVICVYKENTAYPIASLDELNVQIKGIKSRFKTYADFAGKTVEEIFGKEAVDKSVKLKADMFESVVFINEGKGVYSQAELPVEIQFSPVRDILTGDFNNDGIKDLILIGNNYRFRPSLGRYDASFGWFVTGTAGGFKTLMPAESGLFLKGDSRKLSLIQISGDQYLIGSVNNGPIQLFRIQPDSIRRNLSALYSR